MFNESPKPSNHQEIREKLLETINSKVNFVKKLHAFALSLDSNFEEMTASDLEIKLWDMLEEHLENNEILNDAFNKTKILRDLKFKLTTETGRYQLLWPKEKNLQRSLHRELKASYKKEIEEIQSEENVLYIKQLIDYISYLKNLREDRNRLMDLYKQDGGIFKKEGLLLKEISNTFLAFSREMPKGLKQGNLGNANYANYIKDVQFRGLGVVIIFKKQTRDRLVNFRKFEGQNFKHSSLLWCFEDDEEDLVHRHEYNHALFNAHVNHNILYRGGFIHKLDSLINSSKFDQMSQDIKKEDDVYNFVSEYYKELMGEIFADLTNIFDHNLASGFFGHLNNSILSLNKYISRVEDEKIRNILTEAKKDMFSKIKDFELNLAKFVFCSKSLNIKEDAMAVFLLFSGDLRKCFRYLKDRFGDKEIEGVLQNFNPVAHKIFRTESERKIRNIINLIPPATNKEDLE